MELFAIILALALGFVLGLVAGARRAFNLVLSGRAVRTSSARIASFMSGTLPARSAADILAGRVRVYLGATTHDLPVLPRGPSRRWLDEVDARFTALAVQLAATADTPEIMTLLVTETDALYDLLLSYDQSGILPSRDEIDETATDAQILYAVLEVWRAAHPLVDNMLTVASPTSGASAVPPSSVPKPTAGVPTTSTTS